MELLTCTRCKSEKPGTTDPKAWNLEMTSFIHERPDIDKVYMTVCNMMTGSGGWPLIWLRCGHI